MTPATSAHRLPLYIGLNLGFLLAVGIGSAIGGSVNPRLLFLVVMFAVCTSPILDIDRINGRFALLAMFAFVYFVSFAALDLTDVFTGTAREPGGAIFNQTEAVIVAGGITWVLAYRCALLVVGARRTPVAPRDWSKTSTLMVGVVLWAIGTYTTYLWSVYIVTDTTRDAVRKGLGGLSTFAVSANIMGQMMQPLGLLLLSYALYAFRSSYLLPVVIAIVILQVALGFVVDIKGMAMLGGILVIVTCVLVTGRIPWTWLAAAVLFVIFVFPIFTAYRTAVHGDLGLARTAVIDNFFKVLSLSIAAEDRVNTGRYRAQTFLERATVKGSVEMIVDRTGNGVEFQRGHTLTPIFAAFVPKLIWPDKPDVQTGLLVNSEFHLSDSADVYISPSHLGELYWNFGWAGVLAGMGCIGFLCGYIGGRCNLADTATVTRLLILVLTIKQCIVSFEGALGSTYVVWLRSLGAVAVLHLLFAHVPAAMRRVRAAPSASAARNGRPYPNLLT